MATYYRRIDREVQVSEATAAKATVYFEVGTAEAQTVTVSKAGGAFGASTTTAAQVEGNLYKLVIAAADLDTEGELAFKCVGATDTQYLFGFMVVDHDPFDALAAILDDTGTSGVALPDAVITAAKLAADCITAAKIADDAIAAEHLADDAITAASIATDAIGADAIADGAIDAGAIAGDAITSAKIADDAISAEHLADDAITAASIATDAIAADGLADGAAGEIADKVLTELVADHKTTAGSLADMVNEIRAVAAGKKVVDDAANTISHKDTDNTTEVVGLTRTEDGDETTWTPN